ncbi:hypothetical protein [Streptomyces avermitilis]|uniref:hypothetical protein n=1 Tax=Streptomyces avermitilis TaxID=33903 RepID=UPI00382424AA
MMHIFMINGSGVPELIPGILAEAFHVQVSETDVSESSEWEERNWDALVTCEYEPLDGDLRWSLSVYAAEGVQQQPEEQLASLFAQRLTVPVFFAWNGALPWIRQVALPDGGLTLARVVETKDGSTGFYVDAAESPVPGFPDVPVMRFPEVVRVLELPTPLTDAAVPPHASEALARIRGLLAGWELLGLRMSSNWPPRGWYSAALYREDLDFREQLDAAAKELPLSERERVESVLRELDSRYRDLTVDDQGRALSVGLTAEESNFSGRPWYWHRRPLTLPWDQE